MKKAPYEIMGCGYYQSNLHYNGSYPTKPRITNAYEFELLTTSDSTCSVNGNRYPHKKGHLLTVRPNQTRYSIGPFECYFIHFKATTENWPNNMIDSLPTMMPISSLISLVDIFQSIINARITPFDGAELFIQAKLLELISKAYQNFKELSHFENNKYQNYQYSIYQAVEYIKENFQEHLTLQKIAGFANLSPSFFHTIFKNILGRTPNQYIHQLRLNKAKELLLNSNLSLEEIAFRSGFNSQSYLNYVFQKDLHTTPGHYRTQQIKNYL